VISCTTHVLDPELACDHRDRVYRAALALCGCPHEAEDLVQETYVMVLSKPRVLRDGDELAYLVGVLRNTFASSRRRAARRPRAADGVYDLDAYTHATAPTPHAAAECHEILAAVAALPRPFRDAVVAVSIAGLSCREAAGELGIRRGTVLSRLFRARRKLLASLEPDGNVA
jgi:RNA polymerase sigma-70 factor (ECF subfamily)